MQATYAAHAHALQRPKCLGDTKDVATTMHHDDLDGSSSMLQCNRRWNVLQISSTTIDFCTTNEGNLMEGSRHMKENLRKTWENAGTLGK